MGDLGSNPGSGRSPGEGNGNPLQYSCLRIPWMEEPGGLQSMEFSRPEHRRGQPLPFPGHPGFPKEFPSDSDGKAPSYNAGDLGSNPGSGRSSGEGNGNPLQYSCLENPMDGGAWLSYSMWGRKELDTTERLPLTWFPRSQIERQLP